MKQLKKDGAKPETLEPELAKLLQLRAELEAARKAQEGTSNEAPFNRAGAWGGEGVCVGWNWNQRGGWLVCGWMYGGGLGIGRSGRSSPGGVGMPSSTACLTHKATLYNSLRRPGEAQDVRGVGLRDPRGRRRAVRPRAPLLRAQGTLGD